MHAYKILLLILPLLTTVLSDKPHIALKFGDDIGSYIMISPDMSPLEEKVSICAWIKKLSATSHTGAWIHYKTIEHHDGITLSDNLSWAYIVSSPTVSHSQKPAHSQWYHVCLTWAYRSGKKTLYYDGVQIGTASSSGLKFSVKTGSLVFGQHHTTYKMEASFSGSPYSFGGEMTKLNILKRELTGHEVATIYKSGICSSFEETFKEDIHLSWETLLSDDTKKHGNIVKLSLTCPDHTHSQPPTVIPTTAAPTTAAPTTAAPTTAAPTTAAPTTAAPTTAAPTTAAPTTAAPTTAAPTTAAPTTAAPTTAAPTTAAPTTAAPTTAAPTTAAPTTAAPTTAAPTTDQQTEESNGGCNNRWSILQQTEFYNKEIGTELLQDLRDIWELLAEFEGHQIDEALIAHLIKHHCANENLTTAEEVEKDGCHNRWAILRSSDFFDNAVTITMMQDLRGRWELLAEFQGHVIDAVLIAHMRKHHCPTIKQP